MSPNIGWTAIARRDGPWQAGGMDAYTSSPSAPSRRASWVVRLARRVSYTVSEMQYASKRASELKFSSGLAESDRAPNTYAEFLLRTSAGLRHEPTAHGRATGRQVR